MTRDLGILPITGRPLTTVNQVHYALMGRQVFCELEGGNIEPICQARRKIGVFQVKLLRNNQWTPSVRRVWAAKGQVEGAPPQICVARTPVGDCSLDDLLAMAFGGDSWIEAPEGDLVIFPQPARRRLVLKHWNHHDQTLLTAKTLGELVAFMREQAGLGQLIDQDGRTPLRAWLIATAAVLVEENSTAGQSSGARMP